VKYQFIEEHRQEYPVTVMCQVLEVARTGYYKWRQQPLRAQKGADLVLLRHIRDIFEQSKETYGSYRIQAELAEQGLCCGRKRVARLMRTIWLTDTLAPTRSAVSLMFQRRKDGSIWRWFWTCILGALWAGP